MPEKGNQEIGDRIIEATGFILAAHGTVQLVANAETFDSGNIKPMQHSNCRQ